MINLKKMLTKILTSISSIQNSTALKSTLVVVSTGTETTNDNTVWNYKIWSDGTCECWTKLMYSNVSTSKKWGEVYYSELTSSTPLPSIEGKGFSDTPYVYYTGYVQKGNGWIVGNYTPLTIYNAGGFYLITPMEYSGLTARINIYIRGTLQG